MIGATADAIDKTEDRSRFDKAMRGIGTGARAPASPTTWKRPGACSRWSASPASSSSPLPWVARAAHRPTTGRVREICERGLDLSPTKELLIDESLIGWKEYEMEVVPGSQRQLHHRLRHRKLRPMGIHTVTPSRSRQPRR